MICRSLYLLILIFGLFAGAVHAGTLEITIDGVNDRMLQNIHDTLGIWQYKDDPDLSNAWVRRLHRRAEEEIKAALRPYGYYRAVVAGELHSTESGWRVNYHIDPGAPVLVESADIRLSGDGEATPEFIQLLAEYPIQPGKPLDQGRYEELKTRLQKMALELGYFDAKLERHEIRLDLDRYQGDISLHFNTGPRYQFGTISFDKTVLSPELLMRYVAFKPGDPFSIRALLDLQQALTNSEYFKEVNIDPQRDAAVGLQIPVHVTLVPRKRSKYTFGVGFGTDTGARASVGWERRRLNRRGHRFNAGISISQIRNSVTAKYLIPLKNPRIEQLAFTAGYIDNNPDTSHSKTFLLGVSRTGLRWGWNETVGLNYQREKYTVGTDSGESKLLMPGATWLRIRSDDRIYSTGGTRLQLSIRGASQMLASDTSFLQTQIQGKYIRGVFKNSRIILRGDAGFSLVPDFQNLPPSVRYFAGGDQSIRGYAYNELGPRDSNGDVIGGKHLLVGSIEYEQHIKGKWSAAVFVDTGNAFDDFSEPMKTGVGLGIRWRSPIGLVRVDVARAVSESGWPFRLHLVVGPDF